MWGANSRAQKSRTESTSCSWSGVSARSITGLSYFVLPRRRGSRAHRGTRLRRSGRLDGGACPGRRRGTGSWARSHQGLEIARTNVADERQVCTEPKDERGQPGAVQLRLQEAAVDLLQLVDAADVVDVRGAPG